MVDDLVLATPQARKWAFDIHFHAAPTDDAAG